MSEQKYYTPKMEEFHIGFEYEFKGPVDGPVTGETAWFKDIYKPGDFWDGYVSVLEDHINHKTVRVKQLDKEDIESLGWTHVGSLWFKLNEVPGKLGYWTSVGLRKWSENELFIKGYRGEIVDEKAVEQSYLFSGDVMNKSELKRLMKQLRLL